MEVDILINCRVFLRTWEDVSEPVFGFVVEHIANIVSFHRSSWNLLNRHYICNNMCMKCVLTSTIHQDTLPPESWWKLKPLKTTAGYNFPQQTDGQVTNYWPVRAD